MQTLCSVPAKLILSGEHAVLYKCPALSMAIQLHTQCKCSFTPSQTNSVTIELADYQQKHCLPANLCHKMAVDIESRYTLFENEHAAIQSVLAKPLDLILCTLHHFDLFHNIKKGEWTFTISSDIPVGRGLGSSAAVIVSLLNSLLIHHDIKTNKKTLLALARKVESRQHGKSSGIDPATIIFGGLLEFHANKATKKHKVHNFKSWLIDTGSPESTTGQTVIDVRNHFANDSALWKNFAKATQEITQAWSIEDSAALKLGIKQNEMLLEQIGVVPKKVQNFIRELTAQYQAAAKICGAGSIKGEYAGSLLCISEQPPKELCEKYGYHYQPIRIDNQGVQCQIN
jgi:mevalonate kinase